MTKTKIMQVSDKIYLDDIGVEDLVMELFAVKASTEAQLIQDIIFKTGGAHVYDPFNTEQFITALEDDSIEVTSSYAFEEEGGIFGTDC